MPELKPLFTAEGRFVAPQTYRSTLDGLYQGDWLTWVPETLWLHIHEDVGVEPHQDVCNKISALRLFLSTDVFWSNYLAFEKIVLAFNGRYVDPELVQVCLPEELGYGVTCASQMRVKRFQAEVIQYIRGCFNQVGMLLYPEILTFARPQYAPPIQVVADSAQAQWKPELLGHFSLPQSGEHDPVLVQVGQLHDVEAYIAERLARGASVGAANA